MSTSGSTCNGLVTQMYTFSSWSRPKPYENGHASSGLPYVGFPGLTLTPIPESPLLDSALYDEEREARDSRDSWRCSQISEVDSWSPKAMKNGSLPQHWITNETSSLFPADDKTEEESGKTTTTTTSKSCSVDVQVVKTASYLPKDQPMTREEKRAHVCKLLLFALCGFVIVAGIVLWIFSPAFT